jgi:hypothetical protein
LPTPNSEEQIKKATEQKLAAYNGKMKDLFKERDKHPVDSAEREAAARRIFDLWMEDGE